MVDKDDLTRLWRDYKAGKNRQTRDLLLDEYIPLVKYVAGRLAMNLPSNIEVDDLESYGFFGLLDALEKFDPDRNVRFETYASTRIRGAILDGLRSTDWVPRSVRSKARELESKINELVNVLGRTPADREIAAALELPDDEYYQLLDEVRGTALLSLDEAISAEKYGERLSMGDLVADQEQPVDSRIIHKESVHELTEAIEGLSERERLVLALYYQEELTLKEIGHVLEVSESRVSQIHTKAILTLRGQLS